MNIDCFEKIIAINNRY